MSNIVDTLINTVVNTVVTSPSSGATPTDLQLYLNSTLQSLSITSTQLAPTIWSFSFTPNATGLYTLIAFGSVQFRVQVVAKSLYTFLKNVEDEAMGSWTWNKTDGTLSMLRQDGTALASFSVVDSLTESSRERTG